MENYINLNAILFHECACSGVFPWVPGGIAGGFAIEIGDDLNSTRWSYEQRLRYS